MEIGRRPRTNYREFPLFHELELREATSLRRESISPRDQIVERLPGANQMGFAVANQHFGRQRLAVVVGAHHEAVGAGDFDHQILAHFGRRQRPRADEAAFFLREDIARLAQRPADDHVVQRPFCRRCRLCGTIDIG